MSDHDTPDGPLADVRDWLSETARLLAGSTVRATNYDPRRHGTLVDFDGVEGEEERDRYWLNVPYAFAVITYDPDDQEHHYHVVEPSLTPVERDLLDRLYEDVRDPLIYRDDVAEDPERALWDETLERLQEYGVELR